MEFFGEGIEGEDGEGTKKGGGEANGEFVETKKKERGDGEVEDASGAKIAEGVVIEGKAVTAVVEAGFEEGVGVPAEAGFVGVEANRKLGKTTDS